MTTRFSVTRSPIRQLLMAAAGIVLLIAAIDIVSLHRLSEPPTTDDNGVLTSKGQTERRTDMVWGSLFTAVGGSLFVVGMGGLLTGRPMVELTDDAIRLRIGGPLAMLDIAWDDIVSIRSARDYGDDGRVPLPVVLIEVEDSERYPEELWGAVWDGNVLKVDADGWEASVEDVVIRAELMIGRPQEVEDD
ncbi:MAG: hypothetical protein QNJ81_14765 [Acidimicrobiia bacterium]|nr:hypothetical protein [Acidimicrobiia bacterium]